ncbi:MAG: type II toxin-antitoxin system prevent-host-death family antitoxin [Actinobacteria bacterium]|nr:type II toxin-antitoxin system prevent-host-death family antitoxin [Actinomycetota bacterium]
MEVGVRELRDNLSKWIARAKRGEDILITDRGKPVARLTNVEESPALERLIRKGLVTPARSPKTKIRRNDLIKTKGSVSDLVKEQRR